MAEAAAVGCKRDPRWTLNSFLQYGRLDLYDENSVPYKGLPIFRADNKEKYYKFHRKLIEWKPQCRSLVPEIINHIPYLEKLETSVTVCLVFAWLSLLIGFIFHMIEMFSICSSINSCPMVKVYLMPIRLIIFLLQLIFLITMYNRGKNLKGVYKRLSQEDCSDDFTDNAFKEFDREIEKHCVNRAIVSLIVVLFILVGSSIVESIFHCFWFISCRCFGFFRALRDENKQDDDRNNELLKLKHQDTMGMVPAPSLESRKEMAKITGEKFYNILRPKNNNDFVPTPYV